MVSRMGRVRGGRSVAGVIGTAVVAATALLLTACGGSSGGGGSDSGGTASITWGTNGTDDALAAEKKVIDAFNSSHPTIKVTMQVTPFDSYDTKLTTSLRGKNGPDVFRVNHTNVQAWTDAKFLEPLADAKVNTSAFIPGLVSAGQVNGKQYTLPMDTDARAMFYNPALLKKAGITEVPQTWDDLLTAISKVKSATGAYGFAYRSSGDYDMAYESVGPWMKTAGGAILVQDGSSTKAAAADQSATVDAVEYLQKIVKTGATPPGQSNMTEDTMNQLFAQGKLAFMLGGPWERANILKDAPTLKYGTGYATAPVPAQTAGGKSASTSGGWQVGVAASSKHKDAAFTFLRYLEQSQNLTSIAAAGSFPPLKTGLDSAPWSSDEFYAAFKDELPNSGLPILPVAQLAQVAATFEKQVAPAVLNGSSATSALESFDKQVNDQVLR